MLSKEGQGKACSAVNICFNVLHCFFLGFGPVVGREVELLFPLFVLLNDVDVAVACKDVAAPQTYECWNK